MRGSSIGSWLLCHFTAHPTVSIVRFLFTLGVGVTVATACSFQSRDRPDSGTGGKVDVVQIEAGLDMPAPDKPGADLGKPDLPKPDTALLDLGKPDLHKPDTALPDLVAPDMPPPDSLALDSQPLVDTGCASNKDCDDGQWCTKDTCTLGKCSNPPTGSVCLIGGACYLTGALDPADKGKCRQCDHTFSKRTWAPAKGCVITLAGSSQGFQNGKVHAAKFSGPAGVSVNGAGKVYVADRYNHRIREISVGVGTTLAGSGIKGFHDNKDASKALFYEPTDVAADAGTIYVADRRNHVIRRIFKGAVTTLAGSGTLGLANGPAATAAFNFPRGVAVDSKGQVYVGDSENNVIRMTAGGLVTTFAGTTKGFADGDALKKAMFSFPGGMTVDAKGRVFVADRSNHRVRVVDGNQVSTLAGDGTKGFKDGPAPAARFSQPARVAVGASGEVFVADYTNNRIRVITKGTVRALAGVGKAGFADGKWSSAMFSLPTGVATDAAGRVYVADTGNNRIRVINPLCQANTDCDDGLACTSDLCTMGGCSHSIKANQCLIGGACHTTNAVNKANSCQRCEPGKDTAGWSPFGGSGCVITLAGTGTKGFADGPVGKARFNAPTGLFVDSTGKVYVVDQYNQRIRVIQGGKVSTMAGSGVQGNQDGNALQARFYNPRDVVMDNTGALFISEMGNQAVRRITLGKVTTLASVPLPNGLAMDSKGYLYVANKDHAIRKINSTGLVSVLAGNGQAGSVDGPVSTSSAHFNNPTRLAVDSAGSIYVTELYSHRIRLISGGKVSTFAGDCSKVVKNECIKGYKDGPVATAQFISPYGVAVDSGGKVYVAEHGGNRIRVIANGVVSTLAGDGTKGCTDGQAGKARFKALTGIALDKLGRVYVVDECNKVRVIYP